MEELTCQLPLWEDLWKLFFLKPENQTGKCPAILALHDHGGNKYFGKRRLPRLQMLQHPLIESHQKQFIMRVIGPWGERDGQRGLCRFNT